MDEKTALRKIERKIISAYVASKIAGKVPGYIETLVKGILSPIVNWRNLLRYTLRDFLSSRIRRTYCRPNKKMWVNNYMLIPGKKLYGGIEALILVDTSGSISRSELIRFVSEIYGILKYGKAKKIEIIPWDAKVYDSIILKSYSDIEKIRVTGIKLKGRGGTLITPALERALEKCNNNTCVIIMSDFITLDARKSKTRRLLKQISKKASKCIMLSTYAVWDVEGWEKIKIAI